MPWRKGTHPGAVWRKIDLQVHTPRDPHWQDGAPLPGGSEKNEGKRKEWARAFVNACLQNNIHAVAITDHHDFCLVDYIRDELTDSSRTDDLWVFPGIEITTNDNLQCIVLLDRDATKSHCSRVLNALPAICPEPHDKAKLPPVEPCGKTLKDLVEDLDKISQIAGRYILLPNGSKSSGYKTILKNGNHVSFRNLDFDGIYIDGTFETLKQPDLDKIRGAIPDWGQRRRGILPTSDARTLADIGSSDCWIRLGEPTTEALRQALLVDQARITYQPPRTPSTIIQKLTLKSTLTGGERTFVFNDGLNTLIGGRGSGKSALLEYLRFALGRSTADLNPSDPAHARARSLISDTLKDGYVAIVVTRDGVRESWRRDLSNPDAIEVNVDDDEFSISIPEAHERLQARGYSQKQLSSLMQDPDSSRQQITGLVSAESLSKETGIRQDIRRNQSAAQSLIGRYVKAIRDEQSVKDLKIKRDDLGRRLQSISAALEKGGLSNEQQTLLNVSPEYDEFAQTIAEASSSASHVESRVSALVDDVKAIDIARPEWANDITGLDAARGQVVAKRDEALTSLRDALERVKSIGSAAESLGTTFKPAHEQLTQSVAKVQQKQTELRQLVEQQKSLQAQLLETKKLLRELEQNREGADQILTEIAEGVRGIHGLADQLSGLLEEAAQKSQELGSGLITAQVRLPEEPEPLVEALKTIGEKCNIVDLDNKCRSTARAIMEGNWKNETWKLAKELLDLLAHQITNEDQIDNISGYDCQSIIGSSYVSDITANQAVRLCQNITSEKIAGILYYAADPYVAFRYQDRDSTYIDFERASPGQQASALLEILLNQHAGPLLIDQPEDDLDNQRIMTIVETLQKTKQNRQLIFATHNPNFVVNGDADKVFSLASPEAQSSGGSGARIRIRVDGALETRKVRESITDTMEGGQRAFELRRRKYRFVER